MAEEPAPVLSYSAVAPLAAVATAQLAGVQLTVMPDSKLPAERAAVLTMPGR